MKKLLILLFLGIHLLYGQSLTKINSAEGFISKHSAQLNNKLYIFSDDGTNGEGLYYIDGASNTIHFVKSIIGETSELKESGGKLFFVADDGTHGKELWVSDGTTNGTFMVKDIAIGIWDAFDGVRIFPSFSLNNKFYFIGNDHINGYELWVSDGTSIGTMILKDIASGSSSAFNNPNFDDRYPFFTRRGNEVYFFAQDSASVANSTYDLWRTDGTLGNTIKLYTADEDPVDMLSYNGVIMTNWINYSTDLNTLYIYYDSTKAEKTVNVNPSKRSLLIKRDVNSEPIIYNGKLLITAKSTYFSGGNDTTMYYLIDTNGIGNVVVSDVPNKTTSDEVILLSNKLYLNIYGSLYASDFSSSTFLLPNIGIQLADLTAQFRIINNKLLFLRNDNYGTEAWVTEGTVPSTARLKDINPGSGSGVDVFFETTLYNGNLYFVGESDPNSTYNFWKTDGTSNGTVAVPASIDTFLFSDSYPAVAFNNCLYLNAYSEYSFTATPEIWKYCDGSIGINEPVDHSSIVLYPNPAQNMLFVTSYEPNQEITLTNILGEVLHHEKTSGLRTEIDVSHLPSGMYFLNNRKFVKE